MKTAGIDRLAALTTAIDVVQQGGADLGGGGLRRGGRPLPMLTMFDKQVELAVASAT